jgi:hypothetical protein
LVIKHRQIFDLALGVNRQKQIKDLAHWSFGRFGSLNRHTLHLANRSSQLKETEYYAK